MAHASILPIEEINISHTNTSIAIIVEEVEAEFQLRFFVFYYESRLNLLQDCLEINFFSLKLKEVDNFIGNDSIIFLTEN